MSYYINREVLENRAYKATGGTDFIYIDTLIDDVIGNAPTENVIQKEKLDVAIDFIKAYINAMEDSYKDAAKGAKAALKIIEPVVNGEI